MGPDSRTAPGPGPRGAPRFAEDSSQGCLTNGFCDASVPEAELRCPRQRRDTGIELELHSGRPPLKKASRETLLQESRKHGEALARALSTLDRFGSGKLGWVDPYGDTLFNEQEAHIARQEVTALTERCPDERQKAALLDLAELLEACAATPGSHLWFMGDQPSPGADPVQGRGGPLPHRIGGRPPTVRVHNAPGQYT